MGHGGVQQRAFQRTRDGLCFSRAPCRCRRQRPAHLRMLVHPYEHLHVRAGTKVRVRMATPACTLSNWVSASAPILLKVSRWYLFAHLGGSTGCPTVMCTPNFFNDISFSRLRSGPTMTWMGSRVLTRLADWTNHLMREYSRLYASCGLCENLPRTSEWLNARNSSMATRGGSGCGSMPPPPLLLLLLILLLVLVGSSTPAGTGWLHRDEGRQAHEEPHPSLHMQPWAERLQYVV